MRLGLGSAWTSLAGLGVVLLVASGCQVPVPEENADTGIPDPNQYRPGTDPDTNPERPPSNYQPPGSNTATPRKLALDLRGVAGFAILEEQSTGGTAPLGQLGGSSLAPASSASDSFLWLGSSSAGQVLTRSLDNVSREQLSRAGLGLGVPELAQEDPIGTDPPPSGGAGAPPAPGDAPPPGDQTQGSAGEQAGLLKITDDGRIEPALVELESQPETTEPTPEQQPPPDGSAQQPPEGTSGDAPIGMPPPLPPPPPEPLPRVTALGLSPDGSVYVLFERGFYYRQPTAEEAAALAAAGLDPYAAQSALRCQLFRANGSWQSGSDAAQALAELECVTSQYEVPTWDTRRVMQFDASGKLYFRAVTPTYPQGVFLQYNPTTKALSEKVNANICWHDVQVTPRGSLFYTGTSNGTNGPCSGTSFFRYVSADNRLTEIARDWWNFKYVAEQDPDAPDNERIIFYGPDPNSSGTYSWDSACLYRYNPALPTPAERTEKLVECYRDGWAYVNGQNGTGPQMPQQPSAEELPAFQARCESEGPLFISGEGVTALSQLQDGTLFLVGSFQRKLAGELGCSFEVQANHCIESGAGAEGGPGLDLVNGTKESCEAAGHSWVSIEVGCSDGVSDAPDTCSSNGGTWNDYPGQQYYEMRGSTCAAAIGQGITRTLVDCRAIGQQLTEQVTGLGYLVPATDSNPAYIALLSEPTEKVERYWPVQGADGAQLFYSTYSAGQYNLRMATQVTGEGGAVEIQRRSLLDDYEVYNLQRDPADPNRVLFDALHFSTNSYLFGSIDPSLPTPQDVQDSLQVVEGVSGRVETLIVLPNF